MRQLAQLAHCKLRVETETEPASVRVELTAIFASLRQFQRFAGVYSVQGRVFRLVLVVVGGESGADLLDFGAVDADSLVEGIPGHAELLGPVVDV